MTHAVFFIAGWFVGLLCAMAWIGWHMRDMPELIEELEKHCKELTRYQRMTGNKVLK